MTAWLVGIALIGGCWVAPMLLIFRAHQRALREVFGEESSSPTKVNHE